jgi:hypothetical protein
MAEEIGLTSFMPFGFPQVLPTAFLGGIGNASSRRRCTERQEDGLVSTGTTGTQIKAGPMFVEPGSISVHGA